MPNVIKYKSGNLTGSLQKNNVALGISGSLGPSSTTDWYSSITPVSGKYNIIETFASGVPQIYCPQDDNELIRFAKTKGATGSNTGSVTSVLAWIGTQTNLMATNFEYENIVTNGLVLNLDAGFVGSYPTINNTWYDLSGNASNGTLTNGPTFNSTNSGSIVFDGIDDRVTCAANSIVSNSLTFTIWIKRFNYGTQGTGLVFNRGGGGSTTGMNIYYPTPSNGLGYHWNDDPSTYAYDPGLPIPLNTWCFCCVSVSPTQAIFQVNNNTVVRSYTNVTANTTVGTNIMIGTDYTINRFVNANIAYASMYNRALTQAEITQNYNAQKGRFGL